MQVKEIREMAAAGVKTAAIAAEFGRHYQVIYKVIKGKRYAANGRAYAGIDRAALKD